MAAPREAQGQLNVRVPIAVADRMRYEAKARGVPLTRLVTEALEAFLEIKAPERQAGMKWRCPECTYRASRSSRCPEHNRRLVREW